MSFSLDGGCLCGAIRYWIDRAPSGVGICHCATCRRAAGAQSVAWATVPSAGFAWVAGDAAAHASSPGVVRRHCAACGTSLTYQSEPDSVDVTVASLDDPEAVVPTKEIWLAHRVSWEPIDPKWGGYPGAS